MYGIIYRAYNKINQKNYIGQTTKTLSKRMEGHYSSYSNCVFFHRALIKYKKEDWIWSIVDTADNQDELDEKEKYWIKYYHSFGEGYNLTSGGKGNLDAIVTEEHKRKTRESLLKVRDNNYNSENEQRRGKMVRCIETQEVYPSLSKASKAKRISVDTIKKSIVNPNKITGKYHWEYIEGEERLKYLPNAIYCVELNKYYENFRQARHEDRFHEGHLRIAMIKGDPFEEKHYAGYTFYWVNPLLRNNSGTT